MLRSHLQIVNLFIPNTLANSPLDSKLSKSACQNLESSLMSFSIVGRFLSMMLHLLFYDSPKINELLGFLSDF